MEADLLRRVIMLLLCHQREVALSGSDFTEYSSELSVVIRLLRMLAGDIEDDAE